MKIMAGICMIVCATLIGLERRERLKKALVLIEEIMLYIEYLKNGIRNGGVSLDRLTVDMYGKRSFVSRCAERLKSGEDFHASWKNTTENCPEAALLTQDEKSALLQMGEELGRSDCRSQLEMLERYGEFFGRSQSMRGEDFSKRSKLYVECGALLGTVAAILII